MKTRKQIVFTTTILLVAAGLVSLLTGARHQALRSNDFLDTLEARVNSWNAAVPEDRVYLQFDKPFYKPGEDVWFSAYLREGIELKASEQSEILHVELINPKGNTEKTINLVASEGKALGDFHLDEALPGGQYKVKAWTQWQKNEQGAPIFEKDLTVQKVVLPNLKMKLDFERKAFGPGAEVVASLELNTNENRPLRDHQFNFTASLEGSKLLTQSAETDGQGKALIRFKLPEDLESSDGLLNVMIGHEGLTESISRSIPIILNKIDFEMFPEGGDLVAGLPSRVAFRAKNEFGKPADVKGYVLDIATGQKVSEFNSYHQGMGAFELEPDPNSNYLAVITEPAGVGKTFTLPKALRSGYVLNVDEISKGAVALDIGAPEETEVALIGQVRGKIVYKNVLDVRNGVNKLVIPTHDFPSGVAQFTLFDKNGLEQAERLAFVNKYRKLQVQVKPNKQKYLPREKVKMALKVTDELGHPVVADLSLSVVNDQLLSFADDKSGHLLSTMLLEHDLKQEVEEPGFYFDPEEEKADQALDYLMMTSGWRRFTWKQVIEEDLPELTHPAELARVSGQVIDGYTAKPLANADLSLSTGEELKTDKDGRFNLNQLDLSDPVTVSASLKDYSTQTLTLTAYHGNYRFYLYGQQPSTYKWGSGSNVRTKQNRAMAPANQKIAMGQANFAAAPQMEQVQEIAVMKDQEDMDDFAMDMPMDLAAAEAPAPPVEKALRKEGKKAEVKNLERAKNRNKVADKKEVNELDMLDLADEMFFDGNDIEEEVEEEFQQGWLGNVANARDVQAVAYYRAREFSGPVYEQGHGEGGAPFSPEIRTDFRSTLFWEGSLRTNKKGEATVEFFNSDEISSFRTIVEGMTADGELGRAEQVYFTQLPFSLNTRFPVQVATEDIVSIPVTLKNNTDRKLTGDLLVSAPKGFELVGSMPTSQTLHAGETRSLFLNYKVKAEGEKDELSVLFMAEGLKDGFVKGIEVEPKGFPAELSFSGNEVDQTYEFELAHVVDGSIKSTVTAYPSVVSDLLSGIESILREPYGCFEQTSTSSYPNVMVMNYMNEQSEVDPTLYQRANSLLDKGYKRLVTFETPKKGYEWFGSNPPHEALTAYGLMQFNEMKEVYEDVDQAMIDRTAEWLMSRRDGNGGFKKDPKALDSFGRASNEITNAYIVYSLSEAGFTDIRKEYDAAFAHAMKSKDAYELALVANAAFNLKENNQGRQALAELMKKQQKDGKFSGADHSITRSGGVSLDVETTSLAALAILKSPSPSVKGLQASVDFLVKSRSGYGGFGSTQGTILALKALTSYASFSKRTDEAGTIEVYVDGKKVKTQSYEAGTKGQIALEGLEAHLGPGKHKVRVKYVGVENPLPFSLAVGYSTSLPQSHADCKVSLEQRLSTKKAAMGETVRLSAELKNLSDEGLPMTMAVIGIPAGLSPQPWQLKEMQEKSVIDFYEISGNNVVCYYRQMKPNEVREINLDLKAEVPGRFEAPASSAYLYYTAEHKYWTALPKVEIAQN